MKILNFVFLILLVGLSTSLFSEIDLTEQPSHANKRNQQILIGLSSGEEELMNFQTIRRDSIILPAYTNKFPNDNTYVQLFNSKFNQQKIKVVNRDVIIVLSRALDYDSLFEALLKIRAAKTFGANHVSVASPLILSEVKISGELSHLLVLEDLLATAGADFVIENNQTRVIKQKSVKKNPVTNSDYLLGGNNHQELLYEISSALKKNAYNMADTQALGDSLKGRKIYWVAATTEPVNANFFQTLAQTQWLHSQGAAVHLILPYLPYARSDKPEFDVGVSTQGRLVADLIESVGTQGITVVRAHAPQSLGFFKIHSDEISGRETIIKYLKKLDIDCVVSPDAGFQKDATKYQHELNKAYEKDISSLKKHVCLVVMNKERNSDGQETIKGGTGLENIKNKRVVIIDDETSSGGTLAQVASWLEHYEPESVRAVVTHLAGPAKKSLESDAIKELAVTNTVPIQVKNKKLTILSIADEIAERISQYESNY